MSQSDRDPAGKVAKNKRRTKGKGRLQPAAGAVGNPKAAAAGAGVRVRGLAALEEMLGGAAGISPDSQGAAGSGPAKRPAPQVPPVHHFWRISHAQRQGGARETWFPPAPGAGCGGGAWGGMPSGFALPSRGYAG